MNGYDAWVTREPDYPEPPPQPRCISCGGFLSPEPDGIKPYEESVTCDGEVLEYQMPYDAPLLDILGLPEGATYTQRVSMCGIDRAAHEPHTEIIDGGFLSRWDCRRCGAETLM